MLGGGLNGGKLMGDYPEVLSEKSDYWVRRGRMIPTTPWDSVWNGIAEWMGVKGEITTSISSCLIGLTLTSVRGYLLVTSSSKICQPQNV